MWGRTPRLATGRAARFRSRRRGSWHVLQGVGRWFGGEMKDRGQHEIADNKKAPLRVLVVSRVAGRGSVRSAAVDRERQAHPACACALAVQQNQERVPRHDRGRMGGRRRAFCAQARSPVNGRAQASGQGGSMFGTTSPKNGSGSSSTRPSNILCTRKTLL